MYKWNDINYILVHDSVLQSYTGPWTTWANEMNFDMWDAGPIVRTVELLNVYLETENMKEVSNYVIFKNFLGRL